jgi:anti-sigma factor RsiW
MSLWQRLTGRSDLSCQELVELVTDYLDGSLSPQQRARLQRHIDACPHCSAYLEQLRMTLLELGELREEDLEAPVREELLFAFRDWAGGGAGS